MTSEIYGITGARGAGKDSLARFINMAAFPLFVIRPFAGPLKRMVREIWPWVTEEHMNDPVVKEQDLPEPVAMDYHVDEMARVTGLAVQKRGLVAPSPRRLMQFFGTDYVRKIQDDYWIRQFEKSIAGEARVLAPDTRFPNEAQFLSGISAKIIRVQRPEGERNDVQQTHASELHWKTIPADLILVNPTGDFRPMRKVAELIATGRFSEAVGWAACFERTE
jgi:hypothetical protein